MPVSSRFKASVFFGSIPDKQKLNRNTRAYPASAMASFSFNTRKLLAGLLVLFVIVAVVTAFEKDKDKDDKKSVAVAGAKDKKPVAVPVPKDLKGSEFFFKPYHYYYYPRYYYVPKYEHSARYYRHKKHHW